MKTSRKQRKRPADFQYPSDPAIGMFRTQRELAQHFGVQERTIRSWVAEGMPKKHPCGRWDARQVANWRRDRVPPERPWRWRWPTVS